MANEPDGPKQALEKLLLSYQVHFDVERDAWILGEHVPAKAEFHSRGEKYVLTKKAKLWAVECNEHVLFFPLSRLTAQELERVTGLLAGAEPQLVQPHSEHMYTYLSAIILTDELPVELEAHVKRFRWRKNYKLTFHGWSNIRLAVMDVNSGKVVTNRDGKDLRKVLRTVMASSEGKN